MNKRGVETFIVVAQLRNMNQAAATLHQAQSTICKRMQQLEEDVGTVLFERSKGTRVLHLTPGGEAFLDIAERWLALDKEVAQLARKEQSLSISIGALYTHGPFMKKCYALLARHTPKLNITIHSMTSDTLYEAVDKKKIDIGLSSMEAAYHSIKVEPYFSEPMLGICLRGSPLATSGIMETKLLDAQHEIYVPWFVNYQIWHDRYFDPRLSGRITIHNSSILADMLMDDKQWAITPASFAKGCFDTQRFTLFRITPAPPARECFKLTRRSARPSVQRGVAIVEGYLNPVLDEEFGPNRDGQNLLEGLS